LQHEAQCIKKENPASGEEAGFGGGMRLGDRADAEHREGGREILRNRREEGEERRDLVVVVIEAEEREFSEFDDRRLERAPKLSRKTGDGRPCPSPSVERTSLSVLSVSERFQRP